MHGGAQTISRRRPRARGDGPPLHPRGAHDRWSAPRPRGWPRAVQRLRGSEVVGPAPAGMVRARSPSAATPPGRPRARGDGPRHTPPRQIGGASAPRPRGWSRPPVRRVEPDRVGPAPAGMVLRAGSGPAADGCRPRARGDGPHRLKRAADEEESAPRPRGWSPHDPRTAGVGQVGPAPAGDGLRMVSAERSPWPSAPRPRGWSDSQVSDRNRLKVGPAPAGMVRAARRWSCARARRPRARGDGPRRDLVAMVCDLSAPHPRRWSVTIGLIPHAVEVGPAPAGMVPTVSLLGGRRFGRPRARGDGPWLEMEPRPSNWSAPRPRGSSPGGVALARDGPVGPAPAGMVHGAGHRKSDQPDHPCRSEHVHSPAAVA